MQDPEEAEKGEQESSKVFIKTKGRFKPVKVQIRNPEKQFAIFNDPLYEYLDNEVMYNKEEHNFGPWIELQRKSSHKYRQRKMENNLPNLTPHVEARVLTHARELSDQPDNYALPHIQRSNGRLSSLRELRSISIELQTQKQQEQSRFRRERSLKQPFLKGNAATSGWILQRQGHSQNQRSNFNYNQCVRQQQQSRLISLKLGPKVNAPYFQLEHKQNQANPELKSRRNNINLLKQLKQHRMSKLK